MNRLHYLFAIFTFFLLTQRIPAAELNWLVNGDFQSKTGWTGVVNLQPGRDGTSCLYIENTKADWTSASQKVELPQPAPPSIEISGWIKTENVVKGSKDWEMARITVVFYDKAGTRLGDWPASIAQIQGTHDWDFYSNQYSVPAGTASATVELALGNAVGRVWFSGLKCLVYDYDLTPLALGQPTHPERKPARQIKSDNWISNPGFETPGSMDWGQVRMTGNGHESSHCLIESNDVPNWTLASQDISLSGLQPAYVVYGGWVRTEKVVRGKEEWEAARLGIDFRDDSGKQLGGWQDSVCKVTGDSDWTYYEKKFVPPAGTGRIHVDAGLGNCVGRAWFDDLSLTLYDASDKKITAVRVTEQATDTSDWYPYVSPAKISDAPLDLSSLNEKPAGVHGFVAVKGGHFSFADGTRIRFWGTDGVGPNLFVGHEEADQTAERMAKLGINLVRLHFLDNDWGERNIFDPKADNTQVFNTETLDQLDYLIAALKKNGIYVYPDWSVGRKFREGDKVPAYQDLEEGAKTVIHFSRRIIELNKKYAETLLTHVNPYTGLALKDDPVYVGNEIVNESSIFCGFGDQKFPQPYWDELQGLYQAWGGKGKITHFKFDWDSQKLMPTENPENTDQSLKFLLKTQMDSNLEMKAFLKKISPHALLTGSNMGLPVLGDIQSDSLMDFMDTHAYWDHPQIWNISGGWANVDRAPMNNNSQLKSPFQGSLIFGLSHSSVGGMPLIVTEWNDCVPNEFRLEGTVLMAAYGALQDWDGMLQFDYGPALIGSVKLNNFSINSRPDNEPLFQAGALIYRLGLLRPSTDLFPEGIADSEVTSNGSKSPWLFDHPWLPYIAKVAKHFIGNKEVFYKDTSELEKNHDATAKTIKSSTGEEFLDYGKGILKLDSPFVQGFAGAIGTGETFKTSDIEMTLAKRNPWASVIAVTLDKEPLAKSKKILLVASARAENNGQVYNSTRTALKEPGQTPILMQGVGADIQIQDGLSTRFSVYPLDESGHAGPPIKHSMEKGILKFKISPKDHASYYLVVAALME